MTVWTAREQYFAAEEKREREEAEFFGPGGASAFGGDVVDGSKRREEVAYPGESVEDPPSPDGALEADHCPADEPVRGDEPDATVQAADHGRLNFASVDAEAAGAT